ncbi:MAG: hypothetical protein LPD71_05870 [Shewanella sp.]|nr:hypothetical protein [Shewanella sp.]
MTKKEERESFISQCLTQNKNVQVRISSKLEEEIKAFCKERGLNQVQFTSAILAKAFYDESRES